MESVPITTKVVSSNPAHGWVYSIQHYMIKFVSDLVQVCDMLRVLQFPPSNKTDCHNKTEILLKVVLNTINLNGTVYQFRIIFLNDIKICYYRKDQGRQKVT